VSNTLFHEIIFHEMNRQYIYFNNNKKVFGELDNGQRLGPILGVFKKKSIKSKTQKTN
jgi:hypothetical protein